MTTRNNRIVIDLNKVQWALFGYRNQYGDYRQLKPKFSVHGKVYDKKEKMFGTTETAFEVATRRAIIDKWTPELKLQLTANHTLTYTGDKAKSLWAEWNRRVFKKK